MIKEAIEAIEGKRDQVCHYLIKDQNVDLEVMDDYHRTALFYATYYNRTEILKVLIDNNANIKAQDIDMGYSAICAAQQGYFDALKILVAKDRSVIGLKGWKGQTPLIAAAINGNADIVRYLIDQNVNLEVTDDYQHTALITAAYHNRTEVLKILVDNDANIKAQTSYGHNAVYLAAHYGYLDALKMLVAKDRSVIDLKDSDGRTPLIIATLRGDVDIVRYSVDENANVNFKDCSGRTALQHTSNPEIIQIFWSKRLPIYRKSFY